MIILPNGTKVRITSDGCIYSLPNSAYAKEMRVVVTSNSTCGLCGYIRNYYVDSVGNCVYHVSTERGDIIISRGGFNVIETLIKRKDTQMNEYIARLFPQTKDAILVYKFFANSINSPIIEILCRGKEEEILKSANEQQVRLDKFEGE